MSKSPDPEHPYSCSYLVTVTGSSSFPMTSPCDTFIQSPFTLLLTINTYVVIQYPMSSAALLIPLLPWCSLPLPLPILAFIVRHQCLPRIEWRFNTNPYYKVWFQSKQTSKQAIKNERKKKNIFFLFYFTISKHFSKHSSNK